MPGNTVTINTLFRSCSAEHELTEQDRHAIHKWLRNAANKSVIRRPAGTR